MAIKNFQELVKGEFAEERKIILEIIDKVLNEMDGYNLVKNAVRMKDDTLFIEGDKKLVIDLNSYKKIYFVGFGKAAGRMAKAMEEFIYFDDGVVICSKKEELKSIKCIVGSHPFPTKENMEASKEILDIVKNAAKDDLIIVVITGGGSAMLCLPRISLQSMVEVTDQLMKAGCSIEELNIVRKHLSHVKGGQLAMATEARMVALIISDIIGNPVDAIASGPTAGDESTFKDAYEILKKYGVKNKEAMEVIKKGMKGEIEETPSKTHAENIIIGDVKKACSIAENEGKKRGYYTKILKCDLQGEAKEIGVALAKYAKVYPRCHSIIIAGGETVVKVKGNGTGGRNQEMVLAALPELQSMPIVFASVGSDGIDGNSPAAGAIADGHSMERARALNLEPGKYLENNDSYTFFKKLKDAIITGYTGTNVMDLQIILKR